MRKLLLIFFTATSSLAYADFVVEKGQTKTTTQTLTANNDVGIVEAGGAIIPVTGDGVDMTGGTYQSLFNYGLIDVTDGTNGVLSNRNNASILNSGTISSSGSFANVGINSSGSNTSILNSGIISGSNGINEGIGITSSGSNTFILNSGIISGSNGGSANFGINSSGSNTSILNSGIISGSNGNNEGAGITSSGSNTFIFNSGTISGSNGGLINFGINSSGNNTSILNSGIISGSGGSLNFGIASTGNNVLVQNSGIIFGTSQALQFGGSNPTLSLLQGSNIQGNVTTTNPLNLDVGLGLNLVLTLAGGTYGALNIDDPFVLVGSTIVVVDPTILSMQADIAADLSDTILNGLYRHRATCNATCCPTFWTEGLGSYRKRDTSHLSTYSYGHGGFLLGYEHPIPWGYAAVFGGGLFGEGQLDSNTEKSSVDTGFGGVLFEKNCANSFFGATFVAGCTKLHNKRQVMNNLIPGGVEYAKSNPSGLFITPEVTYAHQFPNLWLSPLVSGTARYAGLFLGSFAESGSVADLAVRNRNVQLLTVRGTVGLPICGCCCEYIEPYIGGAGRFQLSGNGIDSTLLGIDLNFDSNMPRNLGYFLAGASLSAPLGRLQLTLNGEVNFDNYNSYRWLGEGSLGLSF